MIDLNLPEPEYKACNTCGRTNRLTGTLLHWPHKDFVGDEVSMITGDTMKPFSTWYYICQWHKAADTRKRKRLMKSMPKRIESHG